MQRTHRLWFPNTKEPYHVDPVIIITKHPLNIKYILKLIFWAPSIRRTEQVVSNETNININETNIIVFITSKQAEQVLDSICRMWKKTWMPSSSSASKIVLENLSSPIQSQVEWDWDVPDGNKFSTVVSNDKDKKCIYVFFTHERSRASLIPPCSPIYG